MTAGLPAATLAARPLGYMAGVEQGKMGSQAGQNGYDWSHVTGMPEP